MLKIKDNLWSFEWTDRTILKDKMKEVGIDTFKELAKVMNVSNYYISNVINGHKRIDKTFFEKLKSIGIDLSELIKEKTKGQKALEKIQDITRWLYPRFTYGTKCIFIDGFKLIEEDLNQLEKLEEEVETWRTAYFNLQNQMNQASRRIEELIAQNESKAQKKPKA